MNKPTKWVNEKWWISSLNYNEDVVSNLNLPEKVFVRDSTIREGEETPGVYYTLDEKVSIVEKLEDIGIKHIDCGYIGKVKDQWALANRIKEIGLNLKTYSHLSSNPISWTEEIKRSLEAKVDFVGFGIGSGNSQIQRT